MADSENIHVRDTRDRLLDLLGVGQTYPLQDLPVPDDSLTVTFNAAAQVPVEDSQNGVLYQLHFGGEVVKRTDGEKEVPIEKIGTGGTIHLETYKIDEDITFHILAAKQPWYLFTASGSMLSSELDQQNLPDKLHSMFEAKRGVTFSEDVVVEVVERSKHWIIRKNLAEGAYEIVNNSGSFEVYQASNRNAYLTETGTVKVGLDVELAAWIRDAEHLDPAGGDPMDKAPRIIDYGDPVDVVIAASQEGVDYELVHFPDGENGEELVLSGETPVRGNLNDIVLTTHAINEDLDIYIRATKVFDLEENRETQTALLKAVLPLRVRANTDLEVGVDPDPVIAYGNSAAILVSGTQASAGYRLFTRPIPDRDYDHKNRADWDVVTVTSEGEPTVRVRNHGAESVWSTPQGFTEVGDLVSGNGGEIRLQVENLTEDALYLIRAEKLHAVPSADPLPSHVKLKNSIALLVRPNPEPTLRILTSVAEGTTDGTLEVLEGQPGVFYHFRLEPGGTDLGGAAYIHQKDGGVNKGIAEIEDDTGKLTVEVDFVVARDLSPEDAEGDLAVVDPQPPRLDTGPIATDTTLHVIAVKAQSAIAAPLANTTMVPSGPEIEPEASVIARGASTKIRVTSSRASEWYQLLVDGVPFADAVKGTGRDRLFDTGVIDKDTTLQMLIQMPDEPIAVDRYLETKVWIRPDLSLQVISDDTVVDFNGQTRINVLNSEIGVGYRLLVDGQSNGDWQDGDGALLTFTTPALTDDTEFGIRTYKQVQKRVYFDLAEKVSVAVRPDPSLEVASEDAVIDHGAGTNIQVAASQFGVSYQLTIGESSVGDAMPGSGGAIALPTGSLSEDTVFSVLATKEANAEIKVRLTQQAAVILRPDPSLNVSAVEEALDNGAATEILVEASQRGVGYQLFVGVAAVGEQGAGSGETLALATDGLSEDTTFTVRALKIAQPDIFVDLAGQVTVTVLPEEAPPPEEEPPPEDEPPLGDETPPEDEPPPVEDPAPTE